MGSSSYHIRRLIPRQVPAGGLVESIAGAAEWVLVETDTEEFTSSRTWGIEPGLWVSYTEDLATQAGVVTVFGTDLARADEVAAGLAPMLQPLSDEELLEPTDPEETPRFRALMLVRMAMAAPDTFDQRFFERMQEGFRDPDSRVRSAAIWATSYAPWPEFLPIFRRLAEDPDPRVRQGALETLQSRGGEVS